MPTEPIPGQPHPGQPNLGERPLSAPGEVVGQPKLVITYRTSPEAIAALLPPEFESAGAPIVTLSVYCALVHGEPEYGISTKIPARFGGAEGGYTIGIGIDQESAIFISRETNGQPKFPCTVRYYRVGDTVFASATHQGVTFFEFIGTSDSLMGGTSERHDENEWWIKYSRSVGGGSGFDFGPLVVRVAMSVEPLLTEVLDGELVLRDSDWDPYNQLLPNLGIETARLVTARHHSRTISVSGDLDPAAFEPFADTIGGSRWPGDRGAPRRPPRSFLATAAVAAPPNEERDTGDGS